MNDFRDYKATKSQFKTGIKPNDDSSDRYYEEEDYYDDDYYYGEVLFEHDDDWRAKLLTKKGPGGWDKPAKLHNKPKEVMKKRKPKKQTQVVLSETRDGTDAEFAKLDTNQDNYVQIEELVNMKGAYLWFIFIGMFQSFS